MAVCPPASMAALASFDLAKPAAILQLADSDPLRFPPELSEGDYLAEVLRLPANKTEADLDEELAARVRALGIAETDSASRLSRPTSPSADKRNTNSSAESSSSTTSTSQHARTFSTASNGSASTAVTAHSSDGPEGSARPKTASNAATTTTTPLSAAATLSRRRSKSMSFSQYEKYLLQIDPNINQPKFLKEPPPDSVTYDTSGQSLFSVSTRRSYASIKRGLKTRMRWRKRTTPLSPEETMSCICCRDDFDRSSALQNLPCGHTYCGECLRVMIQQATTDESKMPPRCCTQPIPGTVIKTLLDREAQTAFLKSVLQFSTPWEARIFCPNTSCGEFIPPRNRIDPKHPFDVVCRRCRARVCVMCKRDAHPLGQDCPLDWELDAVLKMGERSGWRRCYKCRTLVELTVGCTHMTCRCKAQFCYICGAVWDPTVGCPNFCNGEEELERRRLEEEARRAEQEAELAAREAAAAIEAAEKIEATRRTKASPEFQRLRAEQVEEMERFVAHARKARWTMWARQAARKQATADRYADQLEKMKDRHFRTASHLEDRQIAAEMELRSTLEQSERSVKIRLRHMEAYCHGLGRNPDPVVLSPVSTGSNSDGGSGSADPPLPSASRVVTERDLRELGQQYNLRDGMERLHQAKINVMRDRQAKRMEELLDRQEQELARLEVKRDTDVENLAGEFAAEEDALVRVCAERKERLQKRWAVNVEVLRKELTDKWRVRFASAEIPDWPDDESDGAGVTGAGEEGGLAVVPE